MKNPIAYLGFISTWYSCDMGNALRTDVQLHIDKATNEPNKHTSTPDHTQNATAKNGKKVKCKRDIIMIQTQQPCSRSPGHALTQVISLCACSGSMPPPW